LQGWHSYMQGVCQRQGRQQQEQQQCSYQVCRLCGCMQGFVLGQYGLLYALAYEDQVERLFILNTPLATNSKLRPELAAYKNPIAFLRPGSVSRGGWQQTASCSRSWRLLTLQRFGSQWHLL
jgi:hypothetical protein